MATLILSAKNFAAMMREIYGYKDLKMNRMLQKTLRNDANLVIKLNTGSRDAISSLIYSLVFNKSEQNPFKDDQAINNPAKGLPAIQYTLAEWKHLVDSIGVGNSTINLDQGIYGVENVHLDMSPWAADMRSLFKNLLAQGTRPNARAA